MVKRLLIGFGVLVVLVIGAALVVPFLIPVETYKAQIEDVAQSATGRPLKINGALRLAILPRLALEADDVSFGNAAGAKNPQMATLKQLVFEVSLIPLLHDTIEIDRLVLVQPQIHLEVDKAGHPNWQFATAGGAPSTAAKPAPGPGALLGGREVRLGEVRLDNGQITYRDDRTGAAYSLDKIAMSVKLPDLESPFGLDGQLDWNGKTIKISAHGKALGKVLAGGGSPLALKIAAQPVNLDFNGNLTRTTPVALDGTVKLAVPSLRELAAWVGSPLQSGGTGFGPLSIEGKLGLAGNRISFSDAALAIDDMKGKGEVTVETGGARPVIAAKLELDKLDLNNYMGGAPQGGAAAGAKPAPQTGKAAPSDWSDEPIDLSPLKAADADIAFTVGGIELQKLKIGKSRLEAKLKDGLLAANLAELNLYGGKGQGRVDLDGRSAVPALKATLALADVEAEPLLKDAADSDRLSGKGSFDFDGSASGKSQRALVSALNGKGKLAFHDGAIKGINLGAMVRNVEGAFLNPKAQETQKTDFSELTGTYTITNGILTNKDLEMVSPLLRVTGAGTVDMPKRTVDYRITPKVVASTQGEGGAFAKKGLMVPVVVSGRWDDLHYQPDLAGVIQENAKGAVEGLIKGATKPGGTSSGTGTSGSPGGILSNPGKALKNLFGQ